MVTTGAAPTAAVIKEELKNHPEKAIQMGIKGGALGVLGAFSSPLSSLVLAGAQNQTAIQGMVQSLYFSSIEAAVHTQRSLNQMEGVDGNQ